MEGDVRTKYKFGKLAKTPLQNSANSSHTKFEQNISIRKDKKCCDMYDDKDGEEEEQEQEEFLDTFRPNFIGL